MTVSYRYILLGDTAENWSDANSKLLKNEPGYDQTNRRLKFGDCKTLWTDLPYINPDVIDSLDSDSTTDAISAAQGKNLKKDVTDINTRVSNLEQYITQIVADGLPEVVDKLESTNSSTDALSARQD